MTRANGLCPTVQHFASFRLCPVASSCSGCPWATLPNLKALAPGLRILMGSLTRLALLRLARGPLPTAVTFALFRILVTNGAAITVAASDVSDTRASFSNYGSCVDIFAPGVGIVSSVRTGGYEAWDGTSMAAPHVSGVVAQLWEVRSMNGRSSLTPSGGRVYEMN